MTPSLDMGLDVHIVSKCKECAIVLLHRDGFWQIRDSPGRLGLNAKSTMCSTESVFKNDLNASKKILYLR